MGVSGARCSKMAASLYRKSVLYPWSSAHSFFLLGSSGSHGPAHPISHGFPKFSLVFPSVRGCRWSSCRGWATLLMFTSCMRTVQSLPIHWSGRLQVRVSLYLRRPCIIPLVWIGRPACSASCVLRSYQSRFYSSTTERRSDAWAHIVLLEKLKWHRFGMKGIVHNLDIIQYCASLIRRFLPLFRFLATIKMALISLSIGRPPPYQYACLSYSMSQHQRLDAYWAAIRNHLTPKFRFCECKFDPSLDRPSPDPALVLCCKALHVLCWREPYCMGSGLMAALIPPDMGEDAILESQPWKASCGGPTESQGMAARSAKLGRSRYVAVSWDARSESSMTDYIFSASSVMKVGLNAPIAHDSRDLAASKRLHQPHGFPSQQLSPLYRSILPRPLLSRYLQRAQSRKGPVWGLINWSCYIIILQLRLARWSSGALPWNCWIS